MSSNMRVKDIIRKPWIIGFSDGTGHATDDDAMWAEGAYILVKDLGYLSEKSKDWTVVVRGGTDEGIKVGVIHEEVATHITMVHNHYIRQKKTTLEMVAALEDALDFATCAEVRHMRLRGTAKLVRRIKKALEG